MAIWVSIKSAAEKYGIPEKQIHEWIRLRYISSSSLDNEPYEDNNPMVNIEEIDKALDFNSLQAHPDDETVERVSKAHLEQLYQENARLEKENDDLMKDICQHTKEEKWLKEQNEKIFKLSEGYYQLTHKIMDYCDEISKQNANICSLILQLLKPENNKALDG